MIYNTYVDLLPNADKGEGLTSLMDGLQGWQESISDIVWPGMFFPGDMAEDEADIEVAAVAKKSPASSSPLKTLKLVLGNETVSTIKLQQD